MVYFYLDDIIANAMIESIKIDGRRIMLIRTAKNYGEKVVERLQEMNWVKTVRLKNIHTNAILLFEKNYSDYFIPFMIGEERGYLLRDGVDVMILENLFRKNYPLEVIEAFSNPEIVKETLKNDQYFPSHDCVYCVGFDLDRVDNHSFYVYTGNQNDHEEEFNVGKHKTRNLLKVEGGKNSNYY